ncbi:MAG: ring-hydroxylating oxygenase subunit alpha [Betaproteobacteria bacterium]|nr:ring-hydroxylating oxygenase subunit alpha [Betaproteobacteria bacterium]
MLSTADNEILVRTNEGTPMGEYFRRYWLPVALSKEMPAPDSPPIRVKAMGEELVAFRDTNGRVGLVEPRCAHRGTSLFFGRNEECGLRCVHHGWKYDVEGKCVDMPNVEPDAAMRGKITIKAYPTREFGEMVWAYLGPREVMPELPQLEHGMLSAPHCYVTKRLQQCNWAQSMDGAVDTAHFSFLHMPAPKQVSNVNATVAADERRVRWLRSDPMPRFTILDHDVGFVVGGARKADGKDLYWRITQFMLPTHSITPSAMPGEVYYGYTWVPVDDESCWIYIYGWHPDRPITVEERARFDKGGYGQFAELGPGYVPLRNRSNDYLIDREKQKKVSFTGVHGIAEQDTMAQESQGAIADRSKEHLTASDIGVVHFRRLMLNEAKNLRDGKEPAAAQHPEGYRLRSGGAVLSGELSFEEVMKQRFGSATGKVTS